MKILVDSDFLVALYKKDDANHKKAIENFKEIEKDVLVATNLVFQESVTVISHRMGMNDARAFHSSIRKLLAQEVRINEDVERKSWNLFLKQAKKGTSFVDCANVVVYKEYKLDKMAAFDGFYKKHATVV